MYQGSDLTTPAQVLEYLTGVEYPASRSELIDAAQNHIPPAEVVQTLESIPDKTYTDEDELIEAIDSLLL